MNEENHGYDPVPALAALIDGVRDYVRGGSDPAMLAALLTGPYASLRGGLLLDEPGREHVSTRTAVREALAAWRSRCEGPEPVLTEQPAGDRTWVTRWFCEPPEDLDTRFRVLDEQWGDYRVHGAGEAAPCRNIFAIAIVPRNEGAPATPETRNPAGRRTP